MTECSVLIVDDSPILRRAMRRAAIQAGVDDQGIFEAGNGREALAQLSQRRADLILLDLNMPIMDGERFAEALAADAGLASIPFAVVSTESNEARIQHLRDLGARAILRKPFEPEELRELISTRLGVDL